MGLVFFVCLFLFAAPFFNKDLKCFFLKDVNTCLYMAGKIFNQRSGYLDLEKSEKYYLEAEDLSPSLAVKYQLSRIYFLTGNFNFSLYYLSKILEVEGDNNEALYLRGLVYGFQQKYELAELDFKKYTNISPGVWAGWNDLSWIYLKQGEYEKAENTALEGLTRFPANPWLHNQLAVALLNLESYEVALEHFRAALSGFEKLKPEEWAAAYPGNSSLDRESGYTNALIAVRNNIELVESKLKIKAP